MLKSRTGRRLCQTVPVPPGTCPRIHISRPMRYPPGWCAGGVLMRSPDDVALEVLEHYRVPRPDPRLERQGNGGGFSGARLWHIRHPAGDLCLRAWPGPEAQVARLGVIHRLMTTAV